MLMAMANGNVSQWRANNMASPSRSRIQKGELVMGGESGSGSGSGNRVPLAVAESRCLHIFIHSFQRQRLPTIAKLWNA